MILSDVSFSYTQKNLHKTLSRSTRQLTLFHNENPELFSHLNKHFQDNSVHAIVGLSGCGKTTLLYLIAALLKPQQGIIQLSDTEFSQSNNHCPKTAIILQDYGLLPWKRVYETIELGLKIQKTAKSERESRVNAIMQELSIEHLAKAYPKQLSGGERQRVAIARALVLQPQVLLMDEPFSSIDAMTREKLQELLVTLNMKHPMTVLLVTHSIEEAVYCSKYIHILQKESSGGSACFLHPIEFVHNPHDRGSNDHAKMMQYVRSQMETVV